MKGLYIHIPFCIKKCSYCDFVSVTNGDEIFEAYIDALLREAEDYAGDEVDTVFIGGGTPTVLPPRLIERLLGGIKEKFNIADNAEITCEGNPGTLTDEKISALINGCVNRMSIGVQSFNDSELRAIGRIHDAETAYNTVCKLSAMGFSNINIDLMTALPGQLPASLAYTLENAVGLPVTHISAYSLILEDGTPLEREYSRGNISVPDEDSDREMYSYTVDFLEKSGFMQYEISNFAKQGFECAHNIKYWDCCEYIGLGAAAHSYIGNRRFSNTSDIVQYIYGNKRQETALSRNDEISEFMMMGLRKTCGISEVTFRKKFGVPIDRVFPNELNRFVKLGLMEHRNGYYRLTRRGMDISNSIMCDFMINI